MDEPDGEQAFRNYMIYGGIWLLKVDEQTCYPKDHIKREDDIPIFLLILEFHNIIDSFINLDYRRSLYKRKHTLNSDLINPLWNVDGH